MSRINRSITLHGHNTAQPRQLTPIKRDLFMITDHSFFYDAYFHVKPSRSVYIRVAHILCILCNRNISGQVSYLTRDTVFVCVCVVTQNRV